MVADLLHLVRAVDDAAGVHELAKVFDTIPILIVDVVEQILAGPPAFLVAEEQRVG